MTWTLTRDLRQRLNSFGTRSLQRILGYRLSDFVSNERLLRETQMRFIICIVREHQLWLYGHVACFPDTDPAHQIPVQQGSLMSGGGQRADHVPRGCGRLISISRWGWTRHLPGGWPDRGLWRTGGKWTQRHAALAHAPIPDLT